jgi:hypothetical protein
MAPVGSRARSGLADGEGHGVNHPGLKGNVGMVPDHRDEAMLAGSDPLEDELGRSVTHVDDLAGYGRYGLGRIREVVVQEKVVMARVGGHVSSGANLHSTDFEDDGEVRTLHQGTFGGLVDSDGCNFGTGC